MQQPFESHQFTDTDGNPAGGTTFGPGFSIAWQNGPLRFDPHVGLPEAWTNGAPTGEELCVNMDALHDQDALCTREPNGAFVETVIAAAMDRLEFYQSSKFACVENAEALAALESALEVLHSRTAKRQDRGVEGTHTA